MFEYLDTFYEVLHTTGHRYIIYDIDLYIEVRTVVQNKMEKIESARFSLTLFFVCGEFFEIYY